MSATRSQDKRQTARNSSSTLNGTDLNELKRERDGERVPG